jgi:hypothetical protein
MRKNYLLESFSSILESKATEAQGLTILKNKGIDNAESIIKNLARGDKSKNQKNIPIMAFIYASGYEDIDNIISVMDDYNELESKKRIKPIVLTKTSIKIGDNEFHNFIKFSEYIHGEKNKYATKTTGSSVEDFVANKKTLWSGNNIDVYEGDSVGKCIAYSQGGLTGRAYSFCIGQPGNTMYKSYRDSKTSSFYFIVDKNHFKKNEDGSVNLDDPLHIVVFDNTENGVELTDAKNTTGTIAKYGSDPDKYVEYLKSMGVPVDKLEHKPKTEKETEEDKLLGRPNHDLKWFINLPIEYKSAYIGRGHKLTDAQFDYLIGK